MRNAPLTRPDILSDGCWRCGDTHGMFRTFYQNSPGAWFPYQTPDIQAPDKNRQDLVFQPQAIQNNGGDSESRDWWNRSRCTASGQSTRKLEYIPGL